MGKITNIVVGTVLIVILISVLALFSVFLQSNFFNLNILPNNESSSTNLPNSYRLVGWIADWNDLGIQELKRCMSCLNFTMPTWFSLSAQEILSVHINEDHLATLKQLGLPIHPLVNNYVNGFDRDLIDNFLTNSSFQDAFFNKWEIITTTYNFTGINFDFEAVSRSLRPKLNTFLQNFRQRFPNLTISIDVPARINDIGNTWNGAFDYAELGNIVDYVIIMAYDYHWATSEPGPITPLSWLDDIVKYAKKTIPPQKIIIGLPLYGYDWTVSENSTPAQSISFYEGEELKNLNTSSWIRDPTSAEISLNYTDQNGLFHQVYYQDQISFQEKWKIVRSHGLQNIAVWYWGLAPASWFST